MKTKLALAVATVALASLALAGCSAEEPPAKEVVKETAIPAPEVIEETPEPEVTVDTLTPEAQAEVDSMFRTAQMAFYSVAETNPGEPFRKVLTDGAELVVMLNDTTHIVPMDGEGWSVIIDGTTDAASVRVSNLSYSENPEDYIMVGLVREGLEGPGTEVVTGNGKYAGAVAPSA